MAFKFYIDNQLTDQPDNDMDLLTSIKRDKQFGAQLITQDVELSYTGNNDLATGTISGYTYIKSLFDSSVCQEAAVQIYDEVSPSETYLLFRGVIKIPQVIMNEHEPNLSFKVQDDSFYAYIANNRDLKIDFRSTKSKNGVDITPIDVYSLDLFNSATGVFGSSIGVYYHGYRIVDVFAFIIRVISDNKISFRSDYFDGMIPEPFLLKGQDILSPYTVYPLAQEPVYEVSFSEVFDELNKIKNLSFYIDQSDPENPVFVLENTEATYSSTSVYTFEDLKEIRTTVNTDNLYATVRVGSTVLSDGQDDINLYPWNEATSYYGWKQESFYPLGQCNTSSELNLVNQWVLSNNVIQEVVYGQSDAYIDNYFLIEIEQVDDVAFTGVAYRYDYFGQPAPPYFYNFGLNNFNKMKRHSDKFEQSFGTFLGGSGGRFRALKGDTAGQDVQYVTAPASDPNFVPIAGITVQADYVNETTLGGFDDGGNWDNTVSEYTVPSTGDYSFTQHLEFEISGFTNAGFGEAFFVFSQIKLYDSTMTLKASDSTGSGYTLATGNGFHVLDHTFVVNATQTDIVQAEFIIIYQPNQSGSQNVPRVLTMLYTSYFECNGAPDSGIAITNGNSQIRKYLHEFEAFAGITSADFRTLKANPTGAIYFEKDGVTRQGWIDDLKYNDQTGRAQVKIITSSTENATT